MSKNNILKSKVDCGTNRKMAYYHAIRLASMLMKNN